jgi:hypothetical protein
MTARVVLALTLFATGFVWLHASEVASSLPHPRHSEATVETAKTSIYIGNVTLTMPPFRRSGDAYESTYKARVFPYFFYNESGRIAITLTNEELRRIENGETVEFKGEAADTTGEPRRIEGRVVPDDPTSGKIKVRVWVSPRIELIFNTTYRFTGGN